MAAARYETKACISETFTATRLNGCAGALAAGLEQQGLIRPPLMMFDSFVPGCAMREPEVRRVVKAPSDGLASSVEHLGKRRSFTVCHSPAAYGGARDYSSKH